MLALLSAVLPSIFKVVDKAVADKDQAAKIKSDIQTQLLENNAKEIEAAAKIIVAEAQGHSWMQRNWRPITMLVLISLVAAHWLGFTAPNLPESNVNSLLDIVQVGLGGYVLGRSGEKIAQHLNK